MKILRPILWGILVLVLLAAGVCLAGVFRAQSEKAEFPAEAEIPVRSGIRPGDETTVEFSALIPADRRIVSAVLRSGKNSVPAGPVRWQCIRRRWDRCTWRFSALIRAVRPGESGEGMFEVEILPFAGGKKKEKFAVAVPEFSILFPEGEEPGAKLIFADPVPPCAESALFRHRYSFLWLLLLPVLGFLLYRFLRRKKEREVPCWEKAEREVTHLQQDLQSGKMSPERAFSRLCDIVREYLEHRFALPVSRRTTEEFLASLSLSELSLETEEEQFLTEFLRAADLVKFAAFPAGKGKVGDAAEKARALIRRTVPRAEDGSLKKKETSHGI